MNSNIILRVISSLIIVPLVWYVVWCGKSVYEDYSIPLFKIFLAMLGAGLAWEWDNMFHKKQTLGGFWVLMSAVLTAFLAEDNPAFAIWIILVGTTLAYWKGAANLAFSLGTVYICLPLLALSWLYFSNGDSAREMVLWLFFVVWATDVGGFIVGKTVGGPKLWPKVSPKKTWEGAVGGTLLALGAAVLMQHLFLSTAFSVSRALCLSLLIAVVGQVSDLAESVLKRSAGVKDSSNLLPGHGGFLDRFDSYLLLAPLFYYVVLFTLKINL